MTPRDLAVTGSPGRLAVAVELARAGALRRAIRWEPAAGGCAIAAVLVFVREDAADRVVVLRAAVVVVLVGALFVLDDRAAQVLDAVPTTWRYRLTLRVLVALAITGAAFTVLATTVALRIGTSAGVALEEAALLGAGLAAAATAQRRWGVDEPGIVGGVFTFGFAAGLVALPRRWAMLVSPGPQWSSAHLRWAGLLVVVAVALVAVSADAARARRRR
jgi:hypothetical protein